MVSVIQVNGIGAETTVIECGVGDVAMEKEYGVGVDFYHDRVLAHDLEHLQILCKHRALACEVFE